MPQIENPINFLKPPVSEVLLSAQFVPVDGFTAAHYGLLWKEFRQEFPTVEQHAPVSHAVESFGQMIPLKQSIVLPFQIMDGPPAPRIWFKATDDTQLIQIQTDRFMHNWRKTNPGDQYPRYAKMREAFAQELRKFEKFLRDEHLGKLMPDQCEITYINHISSSEGFEDLGKVLNIWNRPEKEKLSLAMEDIQMRQLYIIPGTDNKPIGRVYVEARSAVQAVDLRKVYLVSFTARLKPLGEGIDAVLESLDLGRKWVAKTFIATTTPEIRSVWGEEYEA